MNSVSSIDTHELLSSKENIQPLRRGRDTSILCAALQAETDSNLHQELEKQRNAFEIKLRSNATDDPLAEWCSYIHWIEQSFPKQGREGKLNVVLLKCINKFKDFENYMNDVRFVKLCIKYADMEDNTVELLSQIHRHGIGVLCAELYIAWAEKYAMENCFKKANAIYERGLKCSAQPIELLMEAHKCFQAFLVRKMLNENETFQPSALTSCVTETRLPYNTLQTVTSGQKELIPSVRTGACVLGSAGKLHQIVGVENKPTNNKIIKVYEDGENNYTAAAPKAKIEKIQSKKVLSKENTLKPGPWNNKHKKHMPFTVEAPTSLPFEVHRDEDSNLEKKEQRVTPAMVLRPHKIKSGYEDDNFENAPLFYPEPYDSTKLSMYCKEQVYAGGLEFQFEEIRAIEYRKNRAEKRRLKQTSPQWRDPVEVFSKESEPVQPSLVTKSDIQSKDNSDKNVHEDEDNAKKIKQQNLERRRKTLFTNHLPFPEPSKVSDGPEENLPKIEYSFNQTIHTKEALSEMQQLWFSKPASPVAIENSKPIAKSILKPSKPGFTLYVDESCLDGLKVTEKPLDLTLKGKDLIEGKPASVAFSPQEDENKENGVPEDYCGPIGKPDRKVSGILTPAENVEIAPLSDEEVEVEEDTDGDATAHDFSSIIQCNTTAITETWNFTKGFQFPRGESTPNVRKSLHHKEETNNSIAVTDSGLAQRESKAESVSKKIIVQSSEKKQELGLEGENFIKNLSVIAETSREYRSSSSGSSGTSTLALRSSKYCTPSEHKFPTFASHSTLQKTKVQSLEASVELSSCAGGRQPFNTTLDLMAKLNAMESTTLSAPDVSKLHIEEESSSQDINPFDEHVIDDLLRKADFPRDCHSEGYFLLHDIDLVTPKIGSLLTLGAFAFEVKKVVGEGAYAKIYKLINSKTGEVMVAKFQKPPFPWEFYIVREIQSRIQDENLVSYFMNVESAFFFKNCSILLTRPVEFGDLLTVINKMKQAKIMCQILAMYFTCQILEILEILHSCKIIHGDIKPDNFLLRNFGNKLRLQLIDFGRSIDMSLFPEKTIFKKIVTTEGFTTIEMHLGKPWTYQIDLYGAANCGHCLLFGDYMKVVEKEEVWNIAKVIPRYWARTEWKNFFVTLLNVKSCDELPDLSVLKKAFDAVLEDSTELEFSLFKLQNLLNGR